MSNVRTVTEETFQNQVLEAQGKIVVDFWAPWCGPCKVVGPEVDKLASMHAEVSFYKLNIDDAPTIAANYHILGIPTIGLFEGGKLAATSVGAKPAAAIARELGL